MSVQSYGSEGSHRMHPCAGTRTVMKQEKLPNTNADREILFMKAFDPYFIFTLHSEFAGS